MWIYRGKFDWFKWAKDEGITIVFFDRIAVGRSVGVYWQWSETPSGNVDVNAYAVTTIHALNFGHADSQDGRRHSVKIKFLIQTEHGWNLTFKGAFRVQRASDVDHPPRNITFTVRARNRTTVQFFAEHRKFTPQITTPQFPGYRVFGGTLLSPRGEREMIVVVLPDKIDNDHPVCVYWQWGRISDTPLKPNVHVEATIHDHIPGQDVSEFSFENNGWSGKASVHESERFMSLTLSDSQDAMTGIRLNLIDTPATVHPAAIARAATSGNSRAGPIGQNTSVILNDTPMPIHCVLDAAADGYRGRTFAVAGFFLSSLGVIPGLGAVTTAVGVLGLALSIVGLFDAFGSVDEPLVKLLFPNETATRRSSAAIPFLDYNAVTFIRIALSNNQLTVDMGQNEHLTEDTYRVSAFIQDQQFWTRIISIPVAPGIKLIAYRMLTVDRWSPSIPGLSITTLPETVLPNGCIISHFSNVQPTSLRKYGVLGSFTGENLFAFGSLDESFALVYNHEDGKFRVKPGNDIRTFPLLVLVDCVIVPKLGPDPSPARAAGRSLGDHTTEASVLDKIGESQNYVAYSWQVFSAPKKHLWGYAEPHLTDAQIVKRTGATVFLRAREWSPWLQLVPPS